MTESHFPGWHYAEAERLLAQVGEMDPGLRVTQTFIARAQAHATLAQHRGADSDSQRILDENSELHTRLQELTTECEQLRERVEELQWDRKDERPKVGGGHG